MKIVANKQLFAAVKKHVAQLSQKDRAAGGVAPKTILFSEN